MELKDVGIIIIIVIAYFPIIYSMQKRIRRLEDEVTDLKNRFNQ